MFLIKRNNGIYHVCYFKQNGKRTSISTKSKSKAEANKFLKSFVIPEINPIDSTNDISIKEMMFEFLKNSEKVLIPVQN